MVGRKIEEAGSKIFRCETVCGDGIECEREASDGKLEKTAKRAFVGAGARVLFYPTLLYNVVRNKLQPEFRWWDQIDQDEGIKHLVIPTRDYLFAPTFDDICQAVDFIHEHVKSGKTTYVHCKAGRGRSTTIVLCYLVEHKGMSPVDAYAYVRSKRPRVLLAASQWQAVQEYTKQRHMDISKIVASTGSSRTFNCPVSLAISQKLVTPDGRERIFSYDDSIVFVTNADLDGYKSS